MSPGWAATGTILDDDAVEEPRRSVPGGWCCWRSVSARWGQERRHLVLTVADRDAQDVVTLAPLAGIRTGLNLQLDDAQLPRPRRSLARSAAVSRRRSATDLLRQLRVGHAAP